MPEEHGSQMDEPQHLQFTAGAVLTIHLYERE